MAGHARLYRRGATYYHRAAIPVDIKDTYPKSEETFSLKTKDYHEALVLVREAAVKTDKKFQEHRQQHKRGYDPDLSDAEIAAFGHAYYMLLMDNDAWERKRKRAAPMNRP